MNIYCKYNFFFFLWTPYLLCAAAPKLAKHGSWGKQYHLSQLDNWAEKQMWALSDSFFHSFYLFFFSLLLSKQQKSFAFLLVLLLHLQCVWKQWKWREKKGKGWKKFTFHCLVVQERRKMDEVEWFFFHRAHCFGISLIWAKIGGREITKFIRPTTLYYKVF